MTFAEMCGIYGIIGCAYVPKNKTLKSNQIKINYLLKYQKEQSAIQVVQEAVWLSYTVK